MKMPYALVPLGLACAVLGACSGEASTATGNSTVVIEVHPGLGNDFAFRTESASAKAGEVKFVLRNPQLEVKHDLHVEDLEGNQLGATEVIIEGSASFTLEDLEPGEYLFFCSVPGHRPAGMEGTLAVE